VKGRVGIRAHAAGYIPLSLHEHVAQQLCLPDTGLRGQSPKRERSIMLHDDIQPCSRSLDLLKVPLPICPLPIRT
jgi:hypothetical protein